jgi:hypothetical protein
MSHEPSTSFARASLAALAAFSLSSPVLGDVGSPMMIARTMHLLFGNAIIGLLEGLLIAWLFRAPWKKCVPVLILGNYASAILGVSLASLARTHFFPTLYHGASIYDLEGLVRGAFRISVAVSFLVTLVIEWPFCFWALGRSAARLSRWIRADLLVQSVSYACLLGLSSQLSRYDLFEAVRVDPSVVAEAGGGATIYYVSSEDGDLYRVRLDGRNRQRLRQLGLKDFHGTLMLQHEDGAATWQLYLDQYPKPELLASDIRLPAIPGPNYAISTFREDASGKEMTRIRNRRLYSRALSYVPAPQQEWQVNVNSLLGLRVWNERSGEKLTVSLDTPVGTWRVDYGTVLPGAKVVFEMADQILLLDIKTRRLGAIATGHCPVVVPDASSPTATSRSAGR